MGSENRLNFDVLIAGGGFAGVYCAQTLARQLGEDAARKRVAIVADHNYMVFQPMLAEVAGSSISPASRRQSHPLALPESQCAARQHHGNRSPGTIPHARCRDVQPATSTVRFKHLVLAHGRHRGSQPRPGHAGACLPDEKHRRRPGTPRRPHRPPRGGQSADATRPPSSGSSPLSSSAAAIPASRPPARCSISSRISIASTPASPGRITGWSWSTPAPICCRRSAKTSAAIARKTCSKRGVEIILNARVTSMTASKVTLGDGRVIETHTVVSTVGNAPHPILVDLCKKNNIPTDKARIITDATLRVQGFENLWAAGDCAAVPMAIKKGASPRRQARRAHARLPIRAAEVLPAHRAIRLPAGHLPRQEPRGYPQGREQSAPRRSPSPAWASSPPSATNPRSRISWGTGSPASSRGSCGARFTS